MPMMKSVLGLDIGSHTIKAVELRQSFRGLEPGQMRLQLQADAESNLSEDLHRFVKAHDLQTEHLVCAIPGDRLSARRLEFPFRDRKQLAAAIPFEMEGETLFEPEDVVIDWEISGQQGNHSHVVAVLTRREEVSRTLDQFHEAGLEPRILEAEGLVLGNLSALFQLDGARVLADIGHRKTTFCLMLDGKSIAASTIAIGGLAITRALAKDRGCSLEEAEQIKCSEALLDPLGEPVPPEMARVLGRLAREIMRFSQSQEKTLADLGSHVGVTDITIVGGSSKLPGISSYLSGLLDRPVSHLVLRDDPEFADLVSGGDPALFAQAIALSLRASGMARSSLNFRQDDLAYHTKFMQRLSRDLMPTALLAAGVTGMMLFSLGTSLYIESSRANKLEAQSRQLYAEIFPDSDASNPVASLSRALRDAKERADFLGIYGTNQSALDLLAELSRRIPEDLEVRFEEITISRHFVKVKVLGETYEAADRLKNLLAQSAPFTHSEVDKVKSKKRGRGKSFNLTISLSNDRNDGGGRAS